MIDDPALLNFLQREESRATDTTLNEERKTALEFYRGDLMGDEVDGLSKLRTRDVAEVVDGMLASILRAFVSGDRIVEFEPSNPAQEDIAQQITDRIHWNFLREQDGFSILQDGIKAGLIEKSGIWYSSAKRSTVEQQMRVNAAELEKLEADPEVKVRIAQPVETDGGPAYDVSPMLDEMGQPIINEFGEPELESLQIYDVIAGVPGPMVFVDEAIPNEQFFYSPDTRRLDQSPYHGHWTKLSISDLMDMGYSYEDLEPLWGTEGTGQQLADARDEKRGETESSVVRDGLQRLVVLRQEYCYWFLEGRMQRVRIHRVNTTILSIEPSRINIPDAPRDWQPYTLWCPFPMQHRLIGNSLADKTMDIQVASSHLLRQIMNAGYFANMPRLYVNMAEAADETLDDVLDVAPGGIIRGRGQNTVTPITQPFAAGSAFQALELMAAQKESRTGVTRLNRGLKSDALNTETATEFRGLQESGQQMEELVARQAANAVGELFEKKLWLMIEHMQPHDFQFDGQPVKMNPQEWPRDLRLAVRVGLGSGNKDKKIQSIMLLKQSQAEAIQVDPRLVTPEKVFETAKLVTSTLGLGPATQYFNDPAELGPQEPQQDPEVVKAQAEAQQKQAELQANTQLEMAKLELDRQDRAAKLELERQSKEVEWQLARERMAGEFALKERQMMLQAAQADATLSANRSGGRLDA